MSTSTLTARNKLKGKWLLLVAAGAVLVGQLLFFLGSNIYLTYTFDYDEWHFGHPLEQIEWGLLDWVLWDFLPPLLMMIAVAVPLLLVLAYVFFAHKTRVGTLVLSLSIASLALPAIASLTELSYLLRALSVEFYDWLYILQNYFDYNFGSLLSTALSILVVPVLALISAVALMIHPKVGKIVAVIGLSLATVTELLSLVITMIVYITRMFDGFLSSYFVVYPIAEIAYLLFCGLLILTLILNRFDPVFGKQKPVQAEEEAAIDSDVEDDVVEEAVFEAQPAIESEIAL